MAPVLPRLGASHYENSREGSEVIDLMRMSAALTLIAAGFSLAACSSGQAPVGTITPRCNALPKGMARQSRFVRESLGEPTCLALIWNRRVASVRRSVAWSRAIFRHATTCLRLPRGRGRSWRSSIHTIILTSPRTLPRTARSSASERPISQNTIRKAKRATIHRKHRLGC